MIIDSFENWPLYFSGADWQSVSDFLASLHQMTPEGEYSIKDDRIFARVMSYETRSQENAVFEAHQSYIDIQSVVAGAEGIAWHIASNLAVHTPYDPEKDVEFYHTPETLPARVDVFPGIFVVLFPHDAHMPQLKVAAMPNRVKKVVVKVHKSIYLECRGLN